MASFFYFSVAEDLAEGAIDFDTDTFKLMLVTASYTPSQAHSKRSDITNEVSGTGYSGGGVTCTIGVSRSNGVTSLTASNVTLPAPVNGFTARRAVIYKSRGGAASADELVCCIDPGGAIAANGQSLAITFSSAMTLTVPTGT